MRNRISTPRRKGQSYARPRTIERTNRLTDGLVSGIVPHLEVWVVESLLAANALGRVETEHLREKVDGKGIGMGIKRRKWNSGFDG
jgi:hypothetical protein